MSHKHRQRVDNLADAIGILFTLFLASTVALAVVRLIILIWTF